MQAQLGKDPAGEKVIRTCISCGNQDTDEFCSKCGSKLEFLGEKRASPGRNLTNIVKEYLREITDPVFAYLKTNWLVLRHPVKFFHTLYYQDKPISDLPFFFEPVWRLVNRERIQYALQPEAFFASNFIANFVITAIILYFFFGGIFGRFDPSDVPAEIPTLSAAGFTTLIYALATAFIFDFLTREYKISPHFKYSFWVYIFGVGWIGPLVGLFILLFLLIPIMISLCSCWS